MAGDFDYVVDAAEDPDVAVLVTLSGITCEIDAGDSLPILALVAFVVAVNCAEHRWPRLLDGEVTGFSWADGLAFQIYNARGDAGKRQGGGAGFCGRRAGQRRNQDRAGFGLPPSVHDGAAIFADGFEIPFPRGGIDGLTDGAEDAKATQIVWLDPIHAPSHESADGGGGAVKDGNFVTVYNFPEAVLARKIGRAFVHHDGCAVRERAVNDVTVSGDPADVGGAPIKVFIAQIENEPGAPHALQQVTGGSVQDALGFSGGAAGVENVERMFGIKFEGGEVFLGFFF